MDFTEYALTWSKSEVLQGKIMIGIGILMIVAFIAIIKSNVELLRGSLIPLGLLIVVLIGYGGYILYSRPAHVKESISEYVKDPKVGLEKEKRKHINDNKVGKTLIRYVYPSLMIIAALILLLISNPFYKGMVLGFVLLFLSAHIIDNGFVSRSDSFISYIDSLNR